MQSKNVFTTSDVIILPKKFENIIRNAVIRYIYDRGQFTNIKISLFCLKTNFCQVEILNFAWGAIPFTLK